MKIAAMKRMSSVAAIVGRPGSVRVSQGGGGRSSVSNSLVTVFGATGLVGRALVNKLCRQGCQVTVAWHGTEGQIQQLRQLGDLGQITFLKFDVYDKQSLSECMQHSDVVFNLLGRHHPTLCYTLLQSNCDSAANIAHVAAAVSVPHLVHMSHIAASVDSKSVYMRAKALGELAVRKEFPLATIVRAASIYGWEDQFIRLYGVLDQVMPFIPVLGTGIKRPVSVEDVVCGLANLSCCVDAPGKTYEFFGPRAYTVAETVEAYLDVILSKKKARLMPRAVASAAFSVLSKFNPKVVSNDVLLRMDVDEMPSGFANFADAGVLGVLPLELGMFQYTRHFRDPDAYSVPMPEPRGTYLRK